VEADKKTYAQVEVVDDTQLLDSDAILASTDARLDLILKDLEFVETRLGRDPQPAEREALMKIQAALEAEKFVSQAELTPAELGAITVHSFHTYIPVTVARPGISPRRTGCCSAPSPRPVDLLPDGGWQGEPGVADSPGDDRRGRGRSIHTDMQKGFIRAEIIGYDDFIPLAARPRPSGPASSGSRPSSTSCRITTSPISGSTSNLAAVVGVSRAALLFLLLGSLPACRSAGWGPYAEPPVRGRVVDAASGRPLAGVRVTRIRWRIGRRAGRG